MSASFQNSPSVEQNSMERRNEKIREFQEKRAAKKIQRRFRTLRRSKERRKNAIYTRSGIVNYSHAASHAPGSSQTTLSKFSKNLLNKNRQWAQHVSSFLEPFIEVNAKDLVGTNRFEGQPFCILNSDGTIFYHGIPRYDLQNRSDFPETFNMLDKFIRVEQTEAQRRKNSYTVHFINISGRPSWIKTSSCRYESNARYECSDVRLLFPRNITDVTSRLM